MLPQAKRPPGPAKGSGRHLAAAASPARRLAATLGREGVPARSGHRAGAPRSRRGEGEAGKKRGEEARVAAPGPHLRAEVGALDTQLEAGGALQLGLAAAARRLADAGLHGRHAAGLPQARRAAGRSRRLGWAEPPCRPSLPSRPPRRRRVAATGSGTGEGRVR